MHLNPFETVDTRENRNPIPDFCHAYREEPICLSKILESDHFQKRDCACRGLLDLDDSQVGIAIEALANYLSLSQNEITAWYVTEQRWRRRWLYPTIWEDNEYINAQFKELFASSQYLRQVTCLREEFGRHAIPDDETVSRLEVELTLSQHTIRNWYTIRAYQQSELRKIWPSSSHLTLESVNDLSPQTNEFPVESRSTLTNFSKKGQDTTFTSDLADSSITSFPLLSAVGNSSTAGSSRKKDNRLDKDSSERKELYQCLEPGCSYSARDKNDWQSHQTKEHFPLAYFKCWICNTSTPEKLYKRQNVLWIHLKKAHKLSKDDTNKQKVYEHRIPAEHIFHDVCGYCGKPLLCRKESFHHIRRHLEDKKGKGRTWQHQCTLDHTIEAHRIWVDVLQE